MPQRLTESLALTAQTTERSGRLQIGLITPGWGSSGYYSPRVLENAAAGKVFPAGTQMFLDHPAESERHDRPERSVRDLAAVLTEDARWDGGGLVAEAQVFGPYKDLLTDDAFTESVGVSIAAYCDTTIGEAEGRKGTLITELTEAISVDFVTRAGRGGRVMAVLESARAGRATEATVDDMSRALRDAVKAAYGADDTWVWVRDFDPDAGLVWFTVEDADSMAIYQQGYTLDDAGAATLADGDPTEVRARTEYVPVTDSTTESHQPPVAPAGSTPTHESPKEDTMPQIEEGRLAQLEADAGRVHTAEEAQHAAEQRAEAAEARAQAAVNREAARAVINDADHTFTALETRGLLADLPTDDDGALDVDTFTTTVTEAAARAAEAAGAGTIRDFGRTTITSEAQVSDADLDSTLGIARKGA